jgi:hypothetical protein
MKSLVIAGLLSVLMIGRANTQVYYTYPEWDRLSDQARTMYIAGAYDSLVSISSPDTASITPPRLSSRPRGSRWHALCSHQDWS